MLKFVNNKSHNTSLDNIQRHTKCITGSFKSCMYTKIHAW